VYGFVVAGFINIRSLGAEATGLLAVRPSSPSPPHRFALSPFPRFPVLLRDRDRWHAPVPGIVPPTWGPIFVPNIYFLSLAPECPFCLSTSDPLIPDRNSVASCPRAFCAGLRVFLCLLNRQRTDGPFPRPRPQHT
jgi:hypothetical protein